MRIALIGSSTSPILEIVREELKDEHFVVWVDGTALFSEGTTFDIIIYSKGYDFKVCVQDLLAIQPCADAFIVVTSEHGSIPVSDATYTEYQAVKAAQKMVCKCFNKGGTPTVDISPAFVQDVGRNKRMNTDQAYRELIQEECNGEFPVLSGDVAEAIIFAVRNIGKIPGTTIRVSAGWRQ